MSLKLFSLPEFVSGLILRADVPSPADTPAPHWFLQGFTGPQWLWPIRILIVGTALLALAVYFYYRHKNK